MTWFKNIMPRLVSTFAIKSWQDLLLKSLGFFVAINVIDLLLNFTSTFTNDGTPIFAHFWTITIVTIPVLALQFGVVTYLDRLQKSLAHLAMTDVLTGLPNRRSFLNRTEDMRQDFPDGTIFILDADHFKRINDRHGHGTGDACLQAIAQALFKNTHGNDVVGRIGGEEFAAYLPEATEARVRQFGERLTQTITADLSRPLADGTKKIGVTLSIGAAHVKPDQTIELLLSHADDALYRAKDEGRARMVIWDKMDTRLTKAS